MAGMNDEGRQWYVVCTYNGHENKVKENLEKRIESMGLQDCLYNIIIPEHVETVIKDGKKINKVIHQEYLDLLVLQVVEQNLSRFKNMN